MGVNIRLIKKQARRAQPSTPTNFSQETVMTKRKRMNKVCKKCGGALYEAWGDKVLKYEQFYAERMKCLMCGSMYLKKDLEEKK